MNEVQKNSTLTKVLIATNVIMLIVIIFMFVKLNEKTAAIEQMTGTVSSQSLTVTPSG